MKYLLFAAFIAGLYSCGFAGGLFTDSSAGWLGVATFLLCMWSIQASFNE